jgi:P27 family predicted phage terminase small subunit
MSGPPPQPNVIKLLKGNPGKRAIRPEPEPQRPPEVPAAPSFLIGYSADEWYRVAEELYRLNLLTVLDVQPLAAYCCAYDRWRVAEEALARIAANDPATYGLLMKGSSGAVQNPLVKISRDAAEAMIHCASLFGFSPAARARIAAGVAYEPPGGGKFDGLLA